MFDHYASVALDTIYRVHGLAARMAIGETIVAITVTDHSRVALEEGFGVDAVANQPVYHVRKTQVPDDPQGGTLTVGGAVLTIAEAVDWTEREWRLFCQRT